MDRAPSDRRAFLTLTVPHGDHAQCPHCLEVHVTDVVAVCVECDGPVCHFCVLTVEHDARICPDCRPTEAPR